MIDLDEKLPDESPLDDNEHSKSQRGDEAMGDGLDGELTGEAEEDEGRATARLDKNLKLFLFTTLEHCRPRRLSELNIVEKVKPIPPYSSLFVFKHTNKYIC